MKKSKINTDNLFNVLLVELENSLIQTKEQMKKILENRLQTVLGFEDMEYEVRSALTELGNLSEEEFEYEVASAKETKRAIENKEI